MDYYALSVIMLLAQFSPGPDMLLLLRNALSHPARAGLWTVAGIACGLSVHLTVVLVGLSAVIQSSPVLYSLLLIGGGLWLGRLGISLLKSVPGISGSASRDPAVLPLSSKSAFLQGLVTNLSNVKVMIFLGGVVLPLLKTHASTGRKLAFFAIIVGQALVFWSLFVMALQDSRVRRLWNRSQRAMITIFGLSLMGLALQALWQGIRLLPGPGL